MAYFEKTELQYTEYANIHMLYGSFHFFYRKKAS